MIIMWVSGPGIAQDRADVDSYIDRAWELMNEDQYEESLKAFNEIIREAPSRTEGYMGRAFALERLGAYPEARIAYTTVLALDDNNYEARFYLSRLYIREGMYSQAIEQLNMLVDMEFPPTESIIYELNDEGSVNSLHTLQERNDLILYHRARAYRGAGEYSRAERDIDRAINARPERAQYLHEKALLAEEQGDTDGALALYDRLLTVNPGYTAALPSLTELSTTGISDPEIAISAYSKVLNNDSSLIDAWTNRGILYYENNQYRKAEADFLQALKLDSSRAYNWQNHGMALSKLNRFNPAIKDLARAIQLDPANSAARLHLGNAFLMSRKYTEAIKEYNRLLEFDAENSGALYNKGIAYYNLGERTKGCDNLRLAEEAGMVVDDKIRNKVCQ